MAFDIKEIVTATMTWKSHSQSAMNGAEARVPKFGPPSHVGRSGSPAPGGGGVKQGFRAVQLAIIRRVAVTTAITAPCPSRQPRQACVRDEA